MKVEFVSKFHTNQPYREFARYRVGHHEVLVSFGGMAQTWDCQPFRVKARIRQIDGVSAAEHPARRDVTVALKAAFPDGRLAELED